MNVLNYWIIVIRVIGEFVDERELFSKTIYLQYKP